MHHSSTDGPASRRLHAHSRRGGWSTIMLIASLVMFGAFFGLIASGQRGGDTFFSNPWLSGAILSAAGLALASGAIGLVAVIRDHERSPLVFIGMGLGFVVLLFVVGEVTFPH